jgi:methylenetetrahydrofolate reductase (NADPH)
MSSFVTPFVGDVIRKPGVCISYEFFPPKEKDRASSERLYDAVAELKFAHRPDFCSVTWGAGGSTIRNSLDVVSHLTHGMGLLTLAHFTALGMTRPQVDEFLDRFAGTGIHNLLVLRGDRPHGTPAGTKPAAPPASAFRYASELVEYVRSKPEGTPEYISLLVAGCPEGHPEAESKEKDWDHLAAKVKKGADGIVTQLFFDNSAFYAFRDGLAKRGIQVPISIGVMMVTKARMVQKMVELSRCSVPKELQAAIDRYGSDDASMEAFGIDYAVRQVEDLMDHGARHFHFYTLNQSGPTIAVLDRLKSRLGDRPAAEPRTVHIEYREYMAYPDSGIATLFKKYGINAALPHNIVYNHALRRYEITQ